MLRTSLRDKTPTRTVDDPELVEGATELIEAATAEAAIAEVHERLGPDARILDARRDLRGGIGGFFAKEVVRLHAAPGQGRGDAVTEDGARRDAAPVAPEAGLRTSVMSPVERLLDDAPDTVDFATFLRQRMASDPDLRIGAEDRAEVAEHRPATDAIAPVGAEPATHAASPIDATSPVDSAPAADAAPAVDTGSGIVEDAAVAAWRAAARRPLAPPVQPDGATQHEPAPAPRSEVPTADAAVADTMPGPAWSSERLFHLGIPADLVRDLEVDQDADDVTWTMALARELGAACGPLPGGPALLVGPLADELKDQVDEPTARSQVWFDALRDGRWLHLVVGGEGWRDHLPAGPRVVSWTRTQDLPDAVRCARELGLTLGHGPLGGVIRRARPLDVAVAIRALVDGR